jgi:group I intron endonuclease
MTTGIYSIDIVSPRGILGFYGGSGVDCERRFTGHVSKLRLGKHENPKLQNAYNKYVKNGDAELKLTIRLECSVEELLNQEQAWLDFHFAECSDLIYNICRIAAKPPSQKGRKQSAQHIANRREAMKGNKNSLGYKHSEETLAKRSATMTGRPHSPERKANISAAKQGKKLSAAHRANISASLKRRGHGVTQ